MVSEEEYLKAKKIVEEYEDEEFQAAQLEAMYCGKCQALEEHDCFCNPYPDTCEYCHYEVPFHYVDCIYKPTED